MEVDSTENVSHSDVWTEEFIDDLELTDDEGFSLFYRVVATALHSIIFIVGIFGNVILIVAARRSKSLQIPTYSYLVSNTLLLI